MVHPSRENSTSQLKFNLINNASPHKNSSKIEKNNNENTMPSIEITVQLVEFFQL